MFCPKCGLNTAGKFCSSCGNPLLVSKSRKSLYILPILLGIIGGMIMYVMVKNEDPYLAKYGIALGFFVTAGSVILSFFVFNF